MVFFLSVNAKMASWEKKDRKMFLTIQQVLQFPNILFNFLTDFTSINVGMTVHFFHIIFELLPQLQINPNVKFSENILNIVHQLSSKMEI